MLTTLQPFLVFRQQVDLVCAWRRLKIMSKQTDEFIDRLHQLCDELKIVRGRGRQIALARTDATVTEQTGKGHKIAQAVGVTACCAGIVLFIAGAPSGGSLLLIGGFVLFLAARLTAWWSHG